MAKISRRKFLISSAKNAACLGVMAGCNSQTIRPDIRPPSAPVGLFGYSVYEDSMKKVELEWVKHDLSDNTGVEGKEEIKGYNIYYKDSKTPLNTSIIKEPNYLDEGPDGNGLEEGNTYEYQITALDQNENESERSEKYPVKISKPVPVYEVTDDNACNGIQLNADIIQSMVNSAVKAFTEKQSVAEAYELLFPRIKDKYPKIAIKINCLAGNGLCTHPEVVEAIIKGLGQMFNSTYPLHNITVFDDRKESHLKAAGFLLKSSTDDYRITTVYGETNTHGESNWGEEVLIYNTSQRFCKIVEETDYIINVPVLKDHSSAGITFALKNFFGIISDPISMHHPMCDPYVSEVYKIVEKKVKLIIGDAILGAFKGGPSTNASFDPKKILAGNDPVAMDMRALRLINNERQSQSKPLFEIKTKADAQFPSRTDARHIITSSMSKYDLGTTNYKTVEVAI